MEDAKMPNIFDPDGKTKKWVESEKNPSQVSIWKSLKILIKFAPDGFDVTSEYYIDRLILEHPNLFPGIKNSEELKNYLRIDSFTSLLP